jgi:hypothetical protein
VEDEMSEDGDDCLERGGGVEKEADDILFNWYFLNSAAWKSLPLELEVESSSDMGKISLEPRWCFPKVHLGRGME